MAREMGAQAKNRELCGPRTVLCASALVYGLFSSVASAAGVFRCTDDAGNVSFQETACSFDLTQDQIDLQFAKSEKLARAGDDQGFIRFMVQNQLAGFKDSKGRSPLHLACTSPSTGACRWAVTQGEILSLRDQSGLNALHYAARAGSEANVEYLLKAGVGIESLDEQGASALHHSVAASRIKVSKQLLKSGADPNEADLAGMTPLKLAVVNADQDSVRLLMRFDANPDQSDAGKTPVDVAIEGQRNDMLSTLNPAMRKVVSLGQLVSLPTPVDGWNCSTFSSLLGSQVKVLLKKHLQAIGCYLKVDLLEDLFGADPDSNLEVFSLDWLGAAGTVGNAQDEFELTAERYRRAAVKLFVDDDRHIGTLQSEHPMGAGKRAIVTTCAEIVTTLSERLVVINFCHLGTDAADDRLRRGIQASAEQWYDRLVALNSE